MKWVTRENVKVDRVACPWLINRFIDDDAEFGFLPAEAVLDVARREQAISFDAPGARYTHRDGKCTFEILIEEYSIAAPGLDYLARIVHAADIADDEGAVPEGPGFKAIADAFALAVESDIERQRLQWP
ncbi:MAG: chromate resistance protein ChrB domain-containing protein, partial [Dehalococcoidia bacterium]